MSCGWWGEGRVRRRRGGGETDVCERDLFWGRGDGCVKDLWRGVVGRGRGRGR